MRYPRVRSIGPLGFNFNFAQVALRSLSILVSLGAVSFIAWLYNYWRSEPAARVDVLFPSFFPLVAGIFVDAYEIISLLWLDRKRAITPIIIGFDVTLTGAKVFCFMLLSMAEDEQGRGQQDSQDRHASWIDDMNNAMIFMIIASLVQASFIVFAMIGVALMYRYDEREKEVKRMALNQAEIVGFNERKGKDLPVVSAYTA